MQLFVKTVSGKTLTLDVSAASSVHDVKELICERDGLPVEFQTLVCGGKALDSASSLSDCAAVTQDATIHVLMPIVGGSGRGGRGGGRGGSASGGGRGKPAPRGRKENHKGRARQFTSGVDEETGMGMWAPREPKNIESEESDEESSDEEAEAPASKAKAGGKKTLDDDDDDVAFEGEKAEGEEDEDEDEEDDGKPKGIAHLIEIENPNRAKPVTKKASEVDVNQKRELSRREKEEIEKQRAKDSYDKLHAAGKTDQAKADLARLAEVRRKREEAAKKKEAQAAAALAAASKPRK